MVAGCGSNMLKYILFFLNFLICVLALAGVIASLVFILDPGTLAKAGEKVTQLKDLNDMLSSGTIHVGLYVILGASVVILIISFFGCCGAWKEIKCMLGLYAAILLIILIVEVAAFVVAIVFKSKIDDGLKKALTEVQKKNSTIYGDLEKILECCGVDNNDLCNNSKLTYKTGCFEKIKQSLQKFYTIVLAVSIITIIVEILLITFSCCLCSNIGEKVA